MNDDLKRLKMSHQNLEKKIQSIDPTTLPSRVSELEDSKHSHSNKSVLDGITLEKINSLHSHANKNALDTLSTETISLLNKLGVDANGKLTFNGVAV